LKTWPADHARRVRIIGEWMQTEARSLTAMTHATPFFDFVRLLVTVGALAIVLGIVLYVTLQSPRSHN
jgi:hypothetical protein